MLPTTWSETLERQYLYTSSTFLANLRDVTDEEALRQPEAGGNCINWVAGHVVLHRAIALRLLGGEAPFDEAKYERYRRGSDPVTGAEGTVRLSEMAEDFTATRKPFFAAVRGADAELLGRPAPFSPLDDPEETIGSLVAGLLFHESYHIGQLGVLRRLAGRNGVIA